MDIKDYIVYEDEHLLVCHKLPKIATQTSRIGEKDMVSLLKNYLHQQSSKKQEPYLAVIHRLDQMVEGLLVFAKTPFAAKELSRQLQQKGFGKEYRAVVCKTPQQQEGTLVNYMVKDKRSNTSRVCGENEMGAKKAVLHYKVTEEQGDGTAVLHICLETGRHHQIRVQLSNIGCGIMGDAKYNAGNYEQEKWDKIALCAYRLWFVHPKTKKEMVFELE